MLPPQSYGISRLSECNSALLFLPPKKNVCSERVALRYRRRAPSYTTSSRALTPGSYLKQSHGTPRRDRLSVYSFEMAVPSSAQSKMAVIEHSRLVTLGRDALHADSIEDEHGA